MFILKNCARKIEFSERRVENFSARVKSGENHLPSRSILIRHVFSVRIFYYLSHYENIVPDGLDITINILF